MYGYKCEYCEGIVEERLVKQEVFKHKTGFIMLEDVPIGVCNLCGYRYYHSSILLGVEDIASGRRQPERIETIPVGHL